MQPPQPQPNPWQDFFNVYLDLGYMLHAEIARDPASKESADALEHFLTGIREDANPRSDKCRAIVHEVIKQFRGKSREIIFQEPSYFDTELHLFPGVDGVDIAALWRSHPLYRNGLWQYIEQLYVIGNVCLHPNRKNDFLQAVRKLKGLRNPELVQPDDEEEEEEEDMDAIIENMAGQFGMGDNPAMKQLMGTMARSLHGTMTQSDNPMGLLQSILSGDMSALGGLEAQMTQEIESKLESGELTEADFQQSRDGMMNQFGGMQGLMGMAQGLGLQVPGNENPDMAAQYATQAGGQAPQQPQPRQAQQTTAQAPKKKKKSRTKK